MTNGQTQRYVDLVQEILQCPDGQLVELLNENMELVDQSLVEVMGEYASYLRSQSEEWRADFLASVSQYITDFLQQRNINFCKELLLAESDGGRNAVFKLLAQNLRFVNENLGQALIETSQEFQQLVGANKPELQECILLQTHNIFTHLTNFPLGNPRGKLISAIAGYLYFISLNTDNPEKAALAQNNLGTAYRDLSKFSDNPKQEIEYAIASFNSALQVYIEVKHPQNFAMVQNNLGIAYSDLAQFSDSPKQEIERAIASFNSALRVYTEAEQPQAWATTQHNLGTAYRDLATLSDNPRKEIERAIAFFIAALRIRNKAEYPQSWAMTQNNLGLIYNNLAQFSENPKHEIEHAIDFFNFALQVRNETEYPQDFAMTQHNLGIAYSALARFSENPKQEIEYSIQCYYSALRVRNEVEMPQDFARTQNNLGSAYNNLVLFSENPKQEIERAIASFNSALRAGKETEMPQCFVNTQNNLGSAYLNLATFSENPKREIEYSVQCYLTALAVYKEIEMPEAFAMTQNNLGYAYSELAEFSENPKQEIEYSIQCYRAALRVKTPELRSADCLQAAKNLGNLGFKQSIWEIAFEGYSKAIEAVENIRSWATNDARRAEIHAQSIEIYTNIVQALINLERYEEAIEYAERSRSQRIVDLLHSNDLYPQGNISETAKQKLAEFHAKQKAIDILARQLDDKQNQSDRGQPNQSDRGQPNQSDLTEYQLAQLKQLQTEKTEIWNSLRSDDPILAGQVKVDPLPFAKMQELIKGKTDTAILYFYFTSNTLLAFIVLSDQIALHQCPEQNIDNLNNFLFENWLNVYQDPKDPSKIKWRKQMPKILGEIAQRLNLNQLIQTHIPDRIQELIIVPHLYLHQIPFAALPISNSPRLAREGQGVRAEYLSDRYRLRTISSLQILSYCHSRPAIANPTYATIENAQDNLPFAGFEGEQVAEMFQVPSDRRLIGKKAATTDNYRRLLESANSLLSAHHAGSRIDSPLDSKLQLGDGSISLGELMMSRYSDISEIFLSCCETGLGAHQNLTDDILTLATGFLSAGARTVISSLWTVDDLATALFSMFYHQNIKAGSDRPTALYKAQSQLRQLQGSELNEGQPIRQKLDRYFEQQIQLLRDYLKDSKSKHLYQAAIEAKTLEVGKIKSLIYQSAQQVRPFNHPFYWSSFIAQGES